jgi:hypothetical protein
MSKSIRRNSIIAVAAAGLGLVAFAGPSTARAAFDAFNAHQVDGYHASDLSRVSYFAAPTVFDNFNACAYTDILARPFITPKAGVVSVVSSVQAARDTNNPAEGTLTTRVLIDGAVASRPASVNLENDGTQDASVTNVGARRVGKGLHIVKIQAQECGAGMAFIHGESMTASYSPFGSATLPGAARVAARGAANG